VSNLRGLQDIWNEGVRRRKYFYYSMLINKAFCCGTNPGRGELEGDFLSSFPDRSDVPHTVHGHFKGKIKHSIA
jgi:hypothetical protein